jgi:peptidoglycan/LPS O-acetylase OafA/YrhL
MEKSTQQSAKFNSLDTLRGVAALLVFFYHFQSVNPQIAIPDWLALSGKAGHVGLDIFFVLSGFLIFRSLFMHGVNKEYFVRRLNRIAPIYYFSIAVVLLFIDSSYLFSIDGWTNIASHLFFLQIFSTSTYYGINPVLWSLSVEFIFYLFIPLFFLLCGQKNWRIYTCLFLMVAISYVYRYLIMDFYSQWDTTQRIIYTENFIGRLDQFAFGMLASLLTIKVGASKFFQEKAKYLIPSISLLLSIIGAAGIVVGMMLFDEYQSGFREIVSLQVFLHSFIALSAALLIFGLSNSFKIISYILGHKIFTIVGIISYSVYIWHLIIIEQVKKLANNQDLFGNDLIISLSLTLVFSAITYYFIERNFLAQNKYHEKVPYLTSVLRK